MIPNLTMAKTGVEHLRSKIVAPCLTGR